jgi:hypothetical protein
MDHAKFPRGAPRASIRKTATEFRAEVFRKKSCTSQVFGTKTKARDRTARQE